MIKNGVSIRDSGETISLVRNRNVKLNEDTMDLAYVLGVIESDGYVESRYPYEIGLCVKDYDFAEEFSKRLKNIGFRKVRIDKVYVENERWNNMYRVSVRSRMFAEWYYGLKKYNDYERMFGNDKGLIGMFLRGVFDGDGGCYLYKRNGKVVGGVVYFVNTNIELIKYVSKLLNKLGIEHSIVRRGRQRNGRKRALRINIRANSKHKFMEYVGFSIERKLENLKIWCAIGGG